MNRCRDATRVVHRRPRTHPVCWLSAAWVGLCILAIAPPAPALAYRCDAADGAVLYSQFPCRQGKQRIVRTETVVVAIPKLAPDEVARLAQLDRDLAARTARAAKSRAGWSRDNRRRAADSARLCAQARQDLAELANTRRAGYRLADAAQLDREQQTLERTVKTHC
jgi:hypothetical protein